MLFFDFIIALYGPRTSFAVSDPLRRGLAIRVQLTTDGHKPYLEAVEGAFGDDIDYAMLVKHYGEPAGPKSQERKYSPAECAGTRKVWVQDEPDKAASAPHSTRRPPSTDHADVPTAATWDVGLGCAF
jgi:hypothetical protein